MRFSSILSFLFASFAALSASGFSIVGQGQSRLARSYTGYRSNPSCLFSNDDSKADGVVELADEDDVVVVKKESSGPQGPLFISQGEIDPDALNPDFSDAKQTRVLIYTIISILPVLFLIPFMLSREFLPADMLPPVDMTM